MTTKYSGSDWIERARSHWKGQEEPMSDFGRRVADLLGQVYRGIYHLPGCTLEKANWSGSIIEITVHDGNQMATYDADTLTEIVLLSHLMNVRLRIMAAAHNYLRLIFVDMKPKGRFYRDSHPCLDEAIKHAQELAL